MEIKKKDKRESQMQLSMMNVNITGIRNSLTEHFQIISKVLRPQNDYFIKCSVFPVFVFILSSIILK